MLPSFWKKQNTSSSWWMNGMTQEELKSYCEKRGYNSRKYRFRIIEELYGIPEEEAKLVEKTTRELRYLFPKDAVGAELESKWKTPIYQFAYRYEEKQRQLNI